jgi:MFS-type transporter involved in bile tolerance (Atg22 family)
MGRVMGLILTADGVAEALAPVIVARLRDSTGTYATGFTFLIAIALAGAAAVALLPRKRQALS